MSRRPALEDRDLGYEEFTRAIQAIEDSLGVLVGIRGEQGESLQGESLVEYAAANEFGSARIPERSFLRSTASKNQDAYSRELENAVGRYIDDGREAAIVSLKRLGVRAVGDVQTTITELRTPPNSPATIAAKGSSNPLIDTGRMRQSIDSVVVSGADDKVVG